MFLTQNTILQAVTLFFFFFFNFFFNHFFFFLFVVDFVIHWNETAKGLHAVTLKAKVKVKVKSLSRVWLFATPWTVTYQAPPSFEFSRWEYWSGLPFPSPGDLADPGIGPGSPTLQADTLPSEPPGKTLLKAKFCSKREEFSIEIQMTYNFILGFPGGTSG